MLNNHFDKDAYPNYASKVAFKPEFFNWILIYLD